MLSASDPTANAASATGSGGPPANRPKQAAAATKQAAKGCGNGS